MPADHVAAQRYTDSTLHTGGSVQSHCYGRKTVTKTCTRLIPRHITGHSAVESDAGAGNAQNLRWIYALQRRAATNCKNGLPSGLLPSGQLPDRQLPDRQLPDRLYRKPLKGPPNSHRLFFSVLTSPGSSTVGRSCSSLQDRPLLSSCCTSLATFPQPPVAENTHQLPSEYPRLFLTYCNYCS